jgi:pimeloyl-ACP methyl ester carboxylesterase
MSRSPISIVLVPGAWHGPWVWDDVVTRLRAAGHPVAVVTLRSAGSDTGSLGGLYDDAAAFREAAAGLPGDIVAVGHSYGGMVVTEAAADRVRHLVYLSAFVRDRGQNLVSVFGDNPSQDLTPTADGSAVLPADPMRMFYNGVLADVAEAAVRRIVPQSIASLSEPLTRAAWRDIPSTYVISDRDQGVPAALQERMAEHCTVRHHLDTGHSALLSHPSLIAGMITDSVGHALTLAA